MGDVSIYNDWGFTATADILPQLIISLRNRPDGVDKITWQLRVGEEPASYRYQQVSIEDATRDMLDAEQRVHDSRTELIRGLLDVD